MREFIHVEDAANCAIKILESEFINQHLILTGQQSITIENLFEMIQEILSKESITFKFDENSKSEHYKITPYIFNPKFGVKFNPDKHIDLGQGLTQMAAEIFEKVRNEDTQYNTCKNGKQQISWKTNEKNSWNTNDWSLLFKIFNVQFN